MVIPWLMGFPVEMRLGAVGAPEEHRKVKRGREASRSFGVWLEHFYGFGKRNQKWQTIWKWIPSGKLYTSMDGILHVEMHSIWKNDWKRTIIMIISSQHRQHQSSRSNWNAESKWNHDDRTDHKKVSRHDVARYQEGSGYQTLSILKILF